MTKSSYDIPELDYSLKRFEISSHKPRDKSLVHTPRPGTQSYVNTIVLKPMRQEDIKNKLDWYNQMTDRTVTSCKVRGKQSQECWVCGYSDWCRDLEMNFVCFDKDGTYLKWCCDCMAKEMGGKFVPSKELMEARSRQKATTVKKHQEQVVQMVKAKSTPSSSTPKYASLRPSMRFSSREVEEEKKEDYPSPHERVVKFSFSSSDEDTSVLSPLSSTSTTDNMVSPASSMGHFLCTYCQCVLEELRTTFSDDEAAGFHCSNCQNEYYCLACAHESGGRFCNGYTCGSFYCIECCNSTPEEDYFYCCKSCAPKQPKKGGRGRIRGGATSPTDLLEGSDHYFEV